MFPTTTATVNDYTDLIILSEQTDKYNMAKLHVSLRTAASQNSRNGGGGIPAAQFCPVWRSLCYNVQNFFRMYRS